MESTLKRAPVRPAAFALGLIALLALCLAGTDAVAGKKKSDPCKKITKAAKVGCKHDVMQEFWYSTGNCRNVSDAADRADCQDLATEEKEDGLEECSDQVEARNDVCRAIGGGVYDPVINPADFVDPLQIGGSVAANPFFPLIPGAEWVYEGDGETVTVTVTSSTVVIQGVTCIVVRDVVEFGGQVIEDTQDWFGQDVFGNVWYFGEIALNFENGELVDIDGSWKAGADGAKAGIIMHASPTIGDVYRQEFLLGEAEDMGEVLSLTASESVPAHTCNADCLLTLDYTPIEPDARENKYYAPNIGPVLEVDLEDNVRLELMSVSIP